VSPTAQHSRKIATTVGDWTMHEAHVPVRIIWHVTDCECGWSSPLCKSAAAASEHFERHRESAPRRKTGEPLDSPA